MHNSLSLSTKFYNCYSNFFDKKFLRTYQITMLVKLFKFKIDIINNSQFEEKAMDQIKVFLESLIDRAAIKYNPENCRNSTATNKPLAH